MMPSMRAVWGNIALSALSLCVALVILEMSLGFVLPRFTNYYVWQPNLTKIFKPDAAYVPGVTGDSRFMTNAIGLRADPLSADARPRILAIGGSTTECLFLDQEETWTALVQKKLQDAAPLTHPWVGNAGKSGIAVREHVLQVRHLLEEIDGIDLVLVLAGVNDLSNRLAADASYVPAVGAVESTSENLVRAFDVIPRYADARLPWYKRTRVWFLLTKLHFVFSARREVQDAAGRIYAEHRSARAAGKRRANMPALDAALQEYRHRLEFVADEADARGVRLAFITQPSLWKERMSPEEERLLWFGWAGDKWGGTQTEYYSAGAMARAIAAYNGVTLDVCRARGLPCLDLASRVPKTTEYFYDDVHFTEHGSRLVSEIVAAFVRDNIQNGAVDGD